MRDPVLFWQFITVLWFGPKSRDGCIIAKKWGKKINEISHFETSYIYLVFTLIMFLLIQPVKTTQKLTEVFKS